MEQTSQEQLDLIRAASNALLTDAGHALIAERAVPGSLADASFVGSLAFSSYRTGGRRGFVGIDRLGADRGEPAGLGIAGWRRGVLVALRDEVICVQGPMLVVFCGTDVLAVAHRRRTERSTDSWCGDGVEIVSGRRHGIVRTYLRSSDKWAARCDLGRLPDGRTNLRYHFADGETTSTGPGSDLSPGGAVALLRAGPEEHLASSRAAPTAPTILTDAARVCIASWPENERRLVAAAALWEAVWRSVWNRSPSVRSVGRGPGA